MPTNTPHFGFQAFVAGDSYSATVDRSRFLSIDQHMAFLSGIIGPGRVVGWTISQPNPPSLTISVSPGMGMIDNNIIRTFGEHSRSLIDNNLVYVWMRRRPGVIGQAGAFSNISTYLHTDTSPPDVPTGFSVLQTTVSSILLGWDENASDFDFKEFKIYRSLDGSEFSFVKTTSENTYLDTDLDDNTEYYYKISAVDFTGNESSFTLVVSVFTDVDETPPTNPLNITITPATNAIHLLWRPAAFGNIEFYRLYVTPVNLENQPTGSTNVIDISGSLVYASVFDLINNQKYRVRIVSVGTNSVESSGVTLYSTPDFFTGPKDVSGLRVFDKKSDGIISDTVLAVEWDSFIDPYDPNPPVSYEIKIEEVDSENGSIISSVWIRESNESFRDFKIYSYADPNGVIRSRSIRSRTVYFVTVRALDDDGNPSVGRVARHRTRTYKSPNPPSFLRSEQREDQSIEFIWINSTSIFQNNVINLTREDNSDPSNSIVIENNLEVGFSQRYVVTQDLISADSTFRFLIKAVDEFGNESENKEITFDIPDLNSLPPPAAPNQVIGVANDSEITISWNRPNNSIPKGYRIYRAEEQIVYQADDFSRIETVDSSVFSYTDYDVENDTTYAYFVTTIDIYGRESFNPIDDDFFDYNLTLLTPTISGELGTPINLDVQVDGTGTGIDLSWDPTAGQFDGYEIFRSLNNKYQFKRVGTTPPSQTVYNDIEALKYAGEYYYIVRKYRNEADLFVTESNISVSSALFLGTVKTLSGEMEIDQSRVRNIYDIEDPIREKAKDIISQHKHEFFTSIDDRRINLGNIIIVENWDTQDFQNYTTITDISNTLSFDIYLNEKSVAEFNLLYTIDKEIGRITFEQRLAPSDFSRNDQSFLFQSSPELVVIFRIPEETQESLPRDRIESISSTQVISGLIEKRQLPLLDHDGRIKEPLIPVQIGTIAVDDGYRFAPIEENAVIGDAITWYDIILAETSEGDVLLGSNSDGIYTSKDFGATWNRQLSLVTPVIGFYYSANIDLYLAMTNRGVFASRGGDEGGFSVWREIGGMENTKISRGISETPDGEILCTSDLGVFRLTRDAGRDFYFWEQTPILGPASTESYGIIYDNFRSRIIVSNELGIFQTTNAGFSWSFSGEMPDQRPIFQFKSYQNTLFCITRFMVWRRNPGEDEFRRITILKDADLIRKIEIWKGRIFITTDIGLLASVPGSNIIYDEEIDFEIAFPHMNSGNYIPPATSMNIVDNKMFVGTEEYLYLSQNPGKMSLQWEKRAKVVPTIYVNGIEQKIGVRYTTSTSDLRKFICFDEKQRIDAVVTFANQYQKYRAQRGGWADANFASGVRLFINGFAVNDWNVSERPAQAISEIILPEYNDRNAHKAGADIAKDNIIEIAKKTLFNFTKSNVIIFLNSIDRFLSQIYPEARVINRIIDGNAVKVPFLVPAFRVLLLSSNNIYRSYGMSSFGTYSNNSSLNDADIGGPVLKADTNGGIASSGGGGG